MKKSIYYIGLTLMVIIGLGTIACKKVDTPSDVVNNYHAALLLGDKQAVIDLVVPERTEVMIRFVEYLQEKTSDLVISNIAEIITEDTAIVNVTYSDDTTASFSLVKIDGIWKIEPTDFPSYWAVANLRMRGGPGIDSYEILTLQRGEMVYKLVTGNEETIAAISGNWVYVQTENGERGWCFGGYLSNNKDDAFTYWSLTNLRIRQEPSTNAAEILTIQPRARVIKREVGPQATISNITGNWINVLTEDGQSGWAFNGFLTANRLEALFIGYWGVENWAHAFGVLYLAGACRFNAGGAYTHYFNDADPGTWSIEGNILHRRIDFFYGPVHLSNEFEFLDDNTLMIGEVRYTRRN